MTVTKAYKGIKKLFVAGILSLAGSVCGWLAIVPGILGISAVFQGSIGGFFAGGIVTLLLLLASLLLPIIAYILKLIGLEQARSDEPRFYQGFLFALLALILILLQTFFAAVNIGDAAVEGVINTTCGILDITVSVCAIYGIQALARRLEDYKMAHSGASLVRYITVFYAASLFATLLMALFGSDFLIAILAGLLSFITSILNLIYYIVFLVYLGRAKKMLKNGKDCSGLEKPVSADSIAEKAGLAVDLGLPIPAATETK